MGLINRYVLRQIIGPSVLAVTVITVIGVANEIQERVKNLPLGQMTAGDVSRLSLYLLPALIPYVVPITYMMGILLAFGRLAQNNEIVAMKAAGVPVKRIVIPVIIVGALLSGACFVIQDRIQPWAVTKLFQLMETELPLRATLDVLPTGVMHEFDDWRIYVGRREPETGVLKDIVILKPEDDGQTAVYYAASARLLKENGRMILEMTKGHLIPPSKGGQVSRFTFDTTRLPIPSISPPKRTASRRQLNVEQLYAKERETKAQYASTHSEPVKYELFWLRREIAERFSMPFACLAVTLAAAPLGARAKRSGRSYTFGIGLFVIVFYYVLYVLAAPKDLYPLSVILLRSWIPNLALFTAGIVFLWRVDRV